MKKKILALSLMAICLAVGASGTFAFFTTSNTAHNVITTGSIGAVIREESTDSVPYYWNDPDKKDNVMKVMPGKTVSKIVTVENTGTEEAWIRATVETSIKATSGSAIVLLPTEIEYAPGQFEPVMKWDLGAGWIDGNDGYYYYEKPVAAGAFTDPIFKTVTFNPAMDNTYQGCSPELAVQAFAIQVKNNPIPEGKDVTAVWPDNVDYETGEVID